MHRAVVAVVVSAAVLAGCDRPGAPEATPSTRHAAPTAPHTTTAEVPPLHPSVDGYPAATVGLRDRQGREVATVAVRVAATPDHRVHGLMEVPDLPDGTGMLFVFPAQRSGGFWMKNTLVPLDIAFADGDGRILAVLQMVPCQTETCEVYDPEVEYTYALEVPAGWFEEVGVTTEWRLDVPPGTAAAS